MELSFDDENRERPKQFDEDGIKAMFAGVIKQSCEDYKKSGWRGRAVIEKFIRSKWFSTISNIDPEWLIKNLKEKYRINVMVKG